MDLIDTKEAAKICGLKKMSFVWAIRQGKIPFYRGKNGKIWVLRSEAEKWRDVKTKHRKGRRFTQFPPPLTEGEWDDLRRKVQVGWNRRDGLDYHCILREADGQGQVSGEPTGQLGEVPGTE